jgi:hypothetical protein
MITSHMADRQKPTVRLFWFWGAHSSRHPLKKEQANSGRVGGASGFQWFRLQRAINLACTLGVRVHLKRPARTGKSDTV